MTGLILVLLIILIVLVLNIKSQLVEKIEAMSLKIDSLKKQVSQLNASSEKRPEPSVEKTKAAPAESAPIIIKEEIKPIIIKEAIIPPVPLEEERDLQNMPPIGIIDESKFKNFEHVKAETPKQPEPKQKEAKAPQPSFFEKNPDLEKFIGENLINKIGIGILVLGIGFFVKYAISQDWINEIGRTAIGILCGGILIGFAHRLRKAFTAFSSVLVGGGLAILYFTISIAFHEYHVFSQTVAFVIMVVITAFAVLLSISYDRKELAVLAIIGGFSSPFMLSTGEGNYIVLFTYVTVLNLGMLTLAYFKKWNILNIISYVFTVLLFTGWLLTKVMGAENPPYMGALIFATLFYLLFFLMNIINNVKESRSFNVLEISMLLSNTFLYYSAGMYILHNFHGGEFQGLFTVLVAVFNFAFSYALYKNEKVDKNLVFLLIGLVLTFVSLSAPIQLKGNHISMFWAAETVLLLWLSQRSGIQLLKKASIVIMGLMFISLIMDWSQIYIDYYDTSTDVLPVIFNKGFITSLVAILAIYMNIFLLNKEANQFIIEGFEVKLYQKILGVVLLAFLYTGILLELRYQLEMYVSLYSTRDIIIGAYNFIFLIGLNMIARKKEIPFFLEVSFLMGLIGVLSYPVYYHGEVINIRDLYMSSGVEYSSGFLFHYVDVALVVILLIVCYKNMQLKSFLKTEWNHLIVWFICPVLIFLASAELDHIVLLNSYSPSFDRYSVLKQSHKIGFPILWGVCSFILMTIGMRAKRRDLRIISLSLFLIIILKLFIFDIRGISEGGKIAAFIILGVILLVISFMYQKLKKLLLDDDVKIKSE